MSALREQYDVVVVGGGHNALVAAAYLARAGLSVLVLERLARTGGAAVSEELFPGLPARVSAYSSLVGLFPDQVMSDLGIDVELRSRAVSSYAPVLRHGHPTGLLVERHPTAATARSFEEVTGSTREHDAWQAFHGEVEALGAVVAPTLLQPLPAEEALRARVPGKVWEALVERPIGEVLESTFADDTVRGVVATRALTGTFADLHDVHLEQNRRFLYHLVAGGTGEWRFPVGGMGALTGALERAARRAGATLLTRAFVNRLDTDGEVAEVAFRDRDGDHVVECSWVLGGVAPWVLRLLLGVDPGPRPEGAQVQLTMLLDRLPRLRSGIAAERALAGTVHIGEGYAALQDAYAEAARGELPEAPPGHLLCHSLTDPSVLGPLERRGMHTLTWFGLHMPARLFVDDPDAHLDEVVLRVLDSIDVHLEEPLQALLALDHEGNPCLRASSPQNVEAALAMPGGHVFHGALAWPWTRDHRSGTPAERWGVETAWPNVLRCGAGAVRGGAVSGIGGHNAAMAVLETTGAAPGLLGRT